MSIASEITRLQNAKSALATSIGNKGVTVPASTKLDGYSALVDQIQTGGGGGTADDGVWHRPSNWPDYTKIPMSSIGTSEVYLTYDCRNAKAGLEPAGICLQAYVTGGYKVERGQIGSSGFTAVDTELIVSSAKFMEILPTDEGDFVVYRVTPQTSGNSITTFHIADWASYSGNQTLYGTGQPCVEIWGKLEDATTVTIKNNCLVSCSLVLKSVTSMKSFFQDCWLLENIDTTGWSTTDVTLMDGMFFNCYSLKYVDVSDFDLNGVTTISGMFRNCYALEHIDVSDWDTSTVTTMYQTFLGAGHLLELDVSDWDFSGLTATTDTNSIFSDCYRLKRLDFGTTFSSIKASCFSSCRLCTTYIFRSTTLVTLANVNAFNNYNTSMKIYVPDALVNSYKTASNWSNFASYIYPLSEYTE